MAPPTPTPTQTQSRGTNGFAIAALVLGLVGGSVLAIIFGAIGMKQCRERGQDGRGLAIAGLVLGIVGTVFWIIVIIAAASSTATCWNGYGYVAC
jgi:hypothetical protein